MFPSAFIVITMINLYQHDNIDILDVVSPEGGMNQTW